MSDKDNYKIENGTLTVLHDLRRDFDLSFDQACSELLNSDTDELVLNLENVNYINSTYIGMIAAAYFQAQSKNKNMTIRATEPVIHILEAGGFADLITLEKA